MDAGEDRDRIVCAGPQPGGRRPAPGRLELVQAFVNTHYDLELDHGAEILRTRAALTGWLSRRGLIGPTAEAGPADLERALRTREALRRLAAAQSSPAVVELAALDRAAGGAALEVRFGVDGPHLVSADDGVRGALGVILATAAQAMTDGSWARLKVCPGERCGWAFYDHSRNQTGRWCSMAVCGGRAKARAHYHRRSETT
jgi:predicted RNA-binding Zn ribbon-like protein